MGSLPRGSDPAWWRAYAYDVRPRLLLLTVRADLPDGEPFVPIEADDATIDIRPW